MRPRQRKTFFNSFVCEASRGALYKLVIRTTSSRNLRVRANFSRASISSVASQALIRCWQSDPVVPFSNDELALCSAPLLLLLPTVVIDDDDDEDEAHKKVSVSFTSRCISSLICRSIRCSSTASRRIKRTTARRSLMRWSSASSCFGSS